MNAESFVIASGVFNAALAVFHLTFWKLFRWKSALAKLDRLNAAVMQILNLRITWVFIVMAALAFVLPAEMAQSPVGKGLMAGMAIFWVMRAIEQIVFFGLKHPASQAIFAVFLLGAALHGAPLIPG
jgi:hypothetical protein